LDKINELLSTQVGGHLRIFRYDMDLVGVPDAGPHALWTIAEDQDPLEELPEEEVEKQRRKPATASALTLEM
jgi:hypothetical protein